MNSRAKKIFRSSQPVKYSVLSAVLTLAAPDAPASGFALLEQSASRLGTAFAGTATSTEDATSVFFNPAALTHLDGTELSVVASGIDIHSKFYDVASAPAFGQPLGGNGGNAGGWNFVPSGYFSMPLGEKFAYGFGVNAPFGLQTDYDRDWAGRFQALHSEIKTYNFNPTLAYRLNDRVSIGMGVDYQHLQAELTNAVNYSAIVAQGVQQLVLAGTLPASAAPGVLAANAGLEGRANVRGDDSAWGFNVGMLFDLTNTTRLGIAYRSKIAYTIDGTARFTAPAVTQATGAAIVAAAAAPGGPVASSPASVDIQLPDSATISLQQVVNERLTLLADVAWTGWSSVQALTVKRHTGQVVSTTPERWDDSWRFAIGATYAINPAFKLRGGLAFDQTPVPDGTRTPRLPDPERKWVAVGGQWQAAEAMTVDVGYAHLFSGSVPVRENQGNTAAYGLLDGEQHSHVDILSAQLSYRF